LANAGGYLLVAGPPAAEDVRRRDRLVAVVAAVALRRGLAPSDRSEAERVLRRDPLVAVVVAAALRRGLAPSDWSEAERVLRRVLALPVEALEPAARRPVVEAAAFGSRASLAAFMAPAAVPSTMLRSCATSRVSSSTLFRSLDSFWMRFLRRVMVSVGSVFFGAMTVEANTPMNRPHHARCKILSSAAERSREPLAASFDGNARRTYDCRPTPRPSLAAQGTGKE